MTVPIVDPLDTLGVLRAVEAWLSDPEHWTTGKFWRDQWGMGTIRREEVAQTCAVGAVLATTDGWSQGDWPYVALGALVRALGDGESVSSVNDGPDGYARIMAGLRRCIESLEQDR